MTIFHKSEYRVASIIWLAILFGSAVFQFAYSENSRKPDKIWRGGWIGKEEDQQAVITMARKLGFSALICHANDDYIYLNKLCSLAKTNNIDVYYWFCIAGTQDKKAFWQKVSPEEEEIYKRLKEDKTPGQHGCQYGGEPLNPATDIYDAELLCFHRPEVVADCKKKLETVLAKCPGFAGVAFDLIGYKNYRCCHCAVSEKLFDEFYGRLGKDKPSRAKALEQFSLDTLVAFNNDLAAHLRRVKPGIKTGTHIYPVFLADPVYGNRLDLDYCMQTVAWYFEPFWSAEKVEKYTKIVVRDANKYFERPQGIPFVGIFMNMPGMNKPPEQFRKDLKAIRKTGPQSLGCLFDVFVKHPELGDILIQELGLPETIPVP